MKYCMGLLALVFLSCIAHAQTADLATVTRPDTSSPRPKLLVAIAVDQFSSNLFNEYRASFTAGLKRLSQGVVFAHGYQSHAATETCPGHSTILTGDRPARTGIIANDWQAPALARIDKEGRQTFDVYCAEQPGPVGSSTTSGIASPQFLRVPTLGDRMKKLDPSARVVSVAGKDRAAIMLGGHDADLTLWWNGKQFGTYKDRDASVPAGVAAINAQARTSIANPVMPHLPTRCDAHARAVQVSNKVSVGTLQLRKANDEGRWRATPEFDALTLDVALQALQSLQLGQRSSTDLLAISFSATDYVGHSFGTEGAEMCAQMMALDKTIGRLLSALDKSHVPYAVVLTADHGGHDLPERNDIQGLPMAERVDAALAVGTVGAMLAKQFGLAQNPLLGHASFGDMYLSASVPTAQREKIRDAAVAWYRAHRQVAAVFTKDELSAAAAPQGAVEEWSLLERAKASFDAERSGDFVVMLKPFVTPITNPGNGYVATHGSPWNYDRRVPILFWWRGIAGFEQPNGVETVDIAPTLASLIDLNIPAGEMDGRCLDLLAGSASNCPVIRP